METIQSAALIGLGALGILFGKPMADAMQQGKFTVIADTARAARYEAQPITSNGEACRFSFTAPEQGAPVDLVVVAVKATQLAGAVQDIARFVGPQTVIVSLLNGITSEATLEAAYPGHTVLCVSTGMDATCRGKNLSYKNAGKLQIGERDGALSPRVQALGRFFAGCGIACELCTDMVYKQWFKLMINDGLNQVSAALDMDYGALAASDEAQAQMRAAMHETVAVAQAEGVPLTAEGVETGMGYLASFQRDGMPSMRQDVLAQRPTEVDEFAGVVRRLGAKHGIATPVNDALYHRIRAIEAGYGAQQG